MPDYVVPIVKSVLLLMMAFGLSNGLDAQGANMAVDAAAVAPQPVDWSLTGNRLNFLILGVIFFELLVIFYFAYWLKTLLIPAKEKSAVKSVAKTNAWWDRFNKSVDIENEQDVQLDHDYDGIKELNNALPHGGCTGFISPSCLPGCTYIGIMFRVQRLCRWKNSKSPRFKPKRIWPL